jgi:hypothetical protein
MEAVIEHFEGLEYVSPIFALIIESLVDYVHNVEELDRSRFKE